MVATLLTDSAPLVLAVLGGGGLIGAVVALLKLKPEAGQITVVAAQGALVVQTGVIEQLREENERLRARLDAIETELAKSGNLALDNYRLRQRVTELEREVKELKNGH